MDRKCSSSLLDCGGVPDGHASVGRHIGLVMLGSQDGLSSRFVCHFGEACWNLKGLSFSVRYGFLFLSFCPASFQSIFFPTP